MNRNVTHGAKQIIGELNRQPTKNPPRKAFTWQEIVDRSRRKGETKVCDNQNIFHTQRFPAAAAQVHCGGHSARSCSECPSSHGAAWCNGECEWFQGVCVETWRHYRYNKIRHFKTLGSIWALKKLDNESTYQLFQVSLFSSNVFSNN